MARRPKLKPDYNEELDRAEKQFDAFEDQIKTLTKDEMDKAPKLELEPQTKMAQKDIANSKDIYLKPTRTIACRNKFNERFREKYNFLKQYVYFIAENNEVIGENIELWTKRFAGVPAEFWTVPVNKPVWAPRYVAEQIKGCSYHVLSMDEKRITASGGEGEYYGTMVAKNTKQRLDAMPATKQRSIFMGENNF